MIRQAILADYHMIHSFDYFSGDREEDIQEARVFVHEHGGIVRGYLSMARSGLLGRPYVQYLAVDTNFHRNGVATTLLDYIEKHYCDQRLFISTESGNFPMQALLSKRHYVPAGEISGANLNETVELYYFKDNHT